MTTATTADDAARDDARRKNAQKGAFLGFYVDMFDIYLPVLVLAPALAYFVSPDLPDSTRALVTGMIFAATLVGRPLGAMIFGRYADTKGRKNATLVAVGGFGVLTLLLGLMPGYETLGITAVVLFVLLRFVIGIFVGGEYTAASPLAMEYAPKEKRGLYGALIMCGFPLAYVSVATITLVMLQVAPAGGVDSAYVQWGWRIPFFFGGLLALGFVAYYLRSVDESELFASGGGGGNPLKELFTGDNRRNFLQVFVLMTGFWLTLNTVSAVLPELLRGDLELTGTQTSLVLIVAYLVLIGGYIAAGVVSQRVGRRRFMIVAGAVSAVLGTGLYWLLIATSPDSLLVVGLLVTAIVFVIVSVWGLATVYINERFKTGVRATGFGLGYSLAVVLPSFYAFYQSGLDVFLPTSYTVLPLVFLGSVLISVGAVMGPETKDIDFAAVDADGARDEAPSPYPADERAQTVPSTRG